MSHPSLWAPWLCGVLSTKSLRIFTISCCLLTWNPKSVTCAKSVQTQVICERIISMLDTKSGCGKYSLPACASLFSCLSEARSRNTLCKLSFSKTIWFQVSSCVMQAMQEELSGLSHLTGTADSRSLLAQSWVCLF